MPDLAQAEFISLEETRVLLAQLRDMIRGANIPCDRFVCVVHKDSLHFGPGLEIPFGSDRAAGPGPRRLSRGRPGMCDTLSRN